MFAMHWAGHECRSLLIIKFWVKKVMILLGFKRRISKRKLKVSVAGSACFSYEVDF